jgi:hypothetical protein
MAAAALLRLAVYSGSTTAHGHPHHPFSTGRPVGFITGGYVACGASLHRNRGVPPIVIDEHSHMGIVWAVTEQAPFRLC